MLSSQKLLNHKLRFIWRSFISLNWKFGLVLILLICIPRFYLVLQANLSGNYGLIGIIMIISAVIPFIFLNRDGLRSIGLRKSNSTLSLLLSFGLGLLYAFILFGIGYMLYGTTIENWYVYIGKSYNIPDGITSADKLIMFLIMSVTGMIFSPIGEEFYFRGIVHKCFKSSLSENKASIVDSLAFSVTHIAHFGIIFINKQMKIIWISMILWMISMYFASRLFFYCKKKSNSIWGAVFCHSGFNLMMIYCIFYLL